MVDNMLKKEGMKIAFFAVLAVIIVAVPISFYYLYSTSPKLNVTVVDGEPVVFMQNFTQVLPHQFCQYYVYGTSYSLVNLSHHPDSCLTFTASTAAYENPTGLPITHIQGIWYVFGNFAPYLHPSSYTINVKFYNGSQQFNYMQALGQNENTNISWSNNDSFVKLNCISGSQFCYEYSLQNNTQESGNYHFGTNNSSGLKYLGFYSCFISPQLYSVQNLTEKITLSLNVMGTVISVPIVFYLINTGQFGRY